MRPNKGTPAGPARPLMTSGGLILLVLPFLNLACAQSSSSPAPVSHIADTCAPTGVAMQSFTTEKLAVAGQMFSAGQELALTIRENCKQPETATPSGVRTIIVKLDHDVSRDELQASAEQDPCLIRMSAASRAQPLGTSGSIEGKDPNQNSSPYLQDPEVSSQDHLRFLGASEAYGLAFSGAQAISLVHPITIAVIDTGIDMQHEDLKDVLWTNPGEIPNNQIDDDKNGYIDDVHGFNFPLNIGSPQYLATIKGAQHGTHVSGLAAAEGGNGIGGSGVLGAGARIMALNVFASESGAYVSDIANALRYAADNGADVVNLSLGGDGRNADYEAALAYAMGKGVTVLAAAGNSHAQLSNENFMAPAAYAHDYPGMLAIASVDSETDTLSRYSNYGIDYVGLAAPGAQNADKGYGLLSTWPGNRYVRIQGTSMSSPVAAGAAAFAIAMLKARGYAPSPMTVTGILQMSAKTAAPLNSYVKGGRELSLSSLAAFIDKNYLLNTGLAKDPGVPGWSCGH